MIITKSKIDNVVFDGIDKNDHPDYCDAYVISADYEGNPMSSDDIDELNEDKEFTHELLFEHLF